MRYGIYRPAVTPDIPIGEMMRYAGMPKCQQTDLLRQAAIVAEICKKRMIPSVVYRLLDIVSIERDRVVLEGGICICGSLASTYLSECDGVCVLVGTVGIQIDRMIAAYAHRSALEGLLADAAGSAAIEAVMDDFCHFLSISYHTKPRISPGYGDFPLTNQSVIFSLLDATKSIGACLNDSLLISPSKSVSALIGLMGEKHV